MTEFTEWKTQVTPKQVAYRYEEFQYTWSLTRVSLHEHEIIKFTPQGMWIKLYDFCPADKYNRKWVSLQSRKKYACLTEEEALKSFVARKKSQIRILEGQLGRAKQALREGEKLMGKYNCRYCGKEFENELSAFDCCKEALRVR